MRLRCLIFYSFCFFLAILYEQASKCTAEQGSYIINERPLVTYYNEKFMTNLSVVSRRMSRRDPRYYMSICFQSLIIMDNRIKWDFYFYEFVQINKYRRTFLEVHYRLCDLVEKDRIFGPAIRRAIQSFERTECPFPAIHYCLANLTMTLPEVSSGFPFTRGRIYVNISWDHNGVDIPILRGHVDMEIKRGNSRNRKD